MTHPLSKAKLLLVNLQNPGDTKYVNPKTLGAYLLGRRLSNYALFVVQDGNLNQIVLTTANCEDNLFRYWIQNEIDKVINCTPNGTKENN